MTQPCLFALVRFTNVAAAAVPVVAPVVVEEVEAEPTPVADDEEEKVAVGDSQAKAESEHDPAQILLLVAEAIAVEAAQFARAVNVEVQRFADRSEAIGTSCMDVYVCVCGVYAAHAVCGQSSTPKPCCQTVWSRCRWTMRR